MKEQLEQRLADLKTQFECGQKVLGEMETQVLNLRNTLMRLSGAIEVLEEELAKAASTARNGEEPTASSGKGAGEAPKHARPGDDLKPVRAEK